MSYTLALIGHPIGHSLSPWIHRQFIDLAGLEGDYTIAEIPPENDFQTQLSALRKQVDGFNVTVPYKQKIMPYLDELSDDAKRIGAVNTVVSNNGKWIGYNTDGKGYVRSLRENHPSLFGDTKPHIVVIGAGGAARGIFDALVAEGFSTIDIANRTPDKAEAITKLYQDQVTGAVLTMAELIDHMNRYDLVIQTTSVGMKPNVDQAIIPEDTRFKAGSVVSDIVYQPIETRLLQQAKQQGVHVHYGHTMLLYQAQYAFELWTGVRVPLNDMAMQLQQTLEGR